MTGSDITRLSNSLKALGVPDKKAWWERYLKGEIEFFGVPMADIKRTVASWIKDVPRDNWQPSAIALLRREIAEEKLAGIILLQQHLLPSAEDSPDLLREIAEVFAEGSISDWNTGDWLCVRVLGPMIDRDGVSTARDIAEWTKAPGLWQRRCAAVAFVDLAGRGDPAITSIVLAVCRRNVQDPERFAQTGVGWVLRSLSDAEPKQVFEFIRENRHTMSREATRMAASRLSDDQRAALGIKGKRRRR